MILAWLSAAFVIGLMLSPWLPAPLPVLLLLAAALIVAAWLIRRRKRWSALLLILAAASLGASRSSQYHPTPHDLSYYNGSRLQLHGRVAAEPDVRDRGDNYVVSVDHLLLPGRTIAVTGRVQVHTPRGQILEYGDVVTLTGRLLTPRDSAAIPYREILARQGIRSEMRFPRVADLGPSAPSGLGWLVVLRQRIEAGINASLPEPEAALLIAITVGARGASLGDLAPVLVSTGLIHIIAISGVKVALVAGTVHEVTRLARRRLLTLVASLAGLVAYVLITGATPSGVRSGAMWALIFIATYLGRQTVALVSLCVAAACMVALDPSLPLDIGFQMSVVGTLSIVAFATPLGQKLRFLPSPLREAFSVTLSAQAGTVPIVVYGFHLVSLTGPVANALVLPLLPLLIVLGFLLPAVSGVTALASPIGGLTYGLLHASIAIATWLAALPGALPIATLSPLFTACYYLVLVALEVAVLRRANWAPLAERPILSREFSLALVAGASFLTISLPRAGATEEPHLYWLGSDGAMLVRSGGMTALIDGSSHPFALLEHLDQILPYDVRTIDLIVVTDPRAAGITGLETVLDHYAVSEVLDVGAEYPSTTYARWRAELRDRHIPVYALRTGATALLGPVRITAMGPDALYPKPQDSISLLRVSTNRRTYLLAGSASQREQLEAVFRPVSLRADVLVLDSKAPYVPAFVHAVHPAVLLTAGNPPASAGTVHLQQSHPLSLTF